MIPLIYVSVRVTPSTCGHLNVFLFISDVPKERVIPTDASLSQEASIQFDSRFDRWPVIETDNDDIVNRMFDGLRTCTYKPAPPLLISQKLFGSIQCRPYVVNCNIYCSVNLRHRTNGIAGNGQTRLRPPTPCYMETGNRLQTLYLYLLFRSLADLSLLTAHTLIEAIRVGNTNNYDAFYGGIERLWTIVLPFIVWPPICGGLSDLFVNLNAPIYSPPIVIFDGFICICIFLVIMMPLGSSSTSSSSIRDSTGQKLVLQPTKFRYPRTHSNQYLTYRFFLLVPLVIVLGSLWGTTETVLRPFYRRALQSTNFLLGLATSCTFAFAGLFAWSTKSVIMGIGRVHLILLAFAFYALKSAGTSILVGSGNSKWLLVPFEMMGAFGWLSWVGVIAYGQHLIRRSPNGLSYATGTTIFQTYSPHVIMQYTLTLLFFGGGRAIGAALASIWLSLWPDSYNTWSWLQFVEQSVLDNAPDSIVDEEIAVRVLLRLLALMSLILGALFFILYHSCCLNCFISRHNKYQPPNTERPKPASERNGQSYLKLKAKSENEVFPLRSKSEKGAKGNGSGVGAASETTRSMVTLPASDRELETSVDDLDDYDRKMTSR